jgi:group I intron endonuclease
MFIYEIRNKVNSKVYVGQTKAKVAAKRWHQHKRQLQTGKHINGHLQHAWAKYGPDNWEFKVLAEATDEKQLAELEKHWIAEFDSTNAAKGYNLTTGGEDYTKRSKWEGKFAIGHKFGSWEVLDPTIYWTDRRESQLKVRCKCGTIKLAYIGQLVNGLSKTCGCTMSQKGEHHPAFKGDGEISKTKYNNIVRSLRSSVPGVEFTGDSLYVNSNATGTLTVNASNMISVTTTATAMPANGISTYFNLSPELLNNQLQTQQYSCSISGQPINSDTGAVTCLNNNGYVSGNIAWVRKDYRQMQGNMDFETFVKMCREVVEAVDKAKAELAKGFPEKKSDNPIVQKANEIARRANERKSK